MKLLLKKRKSLHPKQQQQFMTQQATQSGYFFAEDNPYVPNSSSIRSLNIVVFLRKDETSLMIASSRGHEKVVDLLLKSGADGLT